MQPERKILIITYYWPPCGGAGVQRWLKFTKYMPEFGWEPYVLTVDPEYAHYPAIDESLEKDIHSSLKIYKTSAINYFRFGKSGKSTGKVKHPSELINNNKNIFARFIRGNFFIPDPRNGWNRYAVSKASELIRKEGINYVITTSPPHSTQLIGLKIKSLFPHINWICDLRDPWTDIYYYNKFPGTWPARMYDRKLERKVLMKADKIITVGKSLAELFLEKIQDSGKDISVITNGYDEEDFVNINIKNDTDREIITYVGSISDQYPIRGFLAALNELYISGRLKKLSVRIVGYISSGIKTMIDRLPVSDAFEFISYTNHKQSIKYMVESKILLLLIPEHKQNDIIITGKLYEYLRSKRVILCIGPPDGDAASIINEMKSGGVFYDSETESIKSFIIEHRNKITLATDTSKFSHRHIVKQLSEHIIHNSS